MWQFLSDAPVPQWLDNVSLFLGHRACATSSHVSYKQLPDGDATLLLKMHNISNQIRTTFNYVLHKKTVVNQTAWWHNKIVAAIK